MNGGDNDDAPDAGAAYVFVRSGATWIQQAYLKAENSGAYDSFGYSVSLDGDFALVGAPDEDGSASSPNGSDDNLRNFAGAAYIFSRLGSTWVQAAYLKGSGNQEEGRFGSSVSLDGGLAVVGAYGELEEGDDNAGAAYVFNSSGGPWTQEARLTASNPDTNDDFGIGVAIDGDTLIVGAYGEDGSAMGVNGPDDNNLSGAGAAYVFARNANIWTQQAYLKPSNAGEDDYFGYAVAIDGDTALVGAYGEDGSATGINGVDDDASSYSGAAYLFTRSGTNWTQQAYLKASNTGENDYFGYSVAIDGGSIFVGASDERGSAASNGLPGDDDNLITGAGAVYVFVTPPLPTGPRILLQRPKAFPATPLRKKSRPQTLRVTNSGDMPLAGLSLKTSGVAAKDFLLTRPVTTLAPGPSATFKVTFRPSAKGTRKATLTARGNTGPVRVPLSGKGK